jgi:hypothetical protein
MRKWFSVNKLAVNFDKTNIIKFITKNSPQHTLSIGYQEKIYRRDSKYRVPWSTDR